MPDGFHDATCYWRAGCSLSSGVRLRPRAQPAESIFDDPVVQAEVSEGLDRLYNMEFEAAARRFEHIARRYPEHPAGPFLEALNIWWKILPDLADDVHDAAFYAAMQEVIERSDRLLKQRPDAFDAMFFKGAALGFRGRLRSNRGEWVQSGAGWSAGDGLRAGCGETGTGRGRLCFRERACTIIMRSLFRTSTRF